MKFTMDLGYEIDELYIIEDNSGEKFIEFLMQLTYKEIEDIIELSLTAEEMIAPKKEIILDEKGNKILVEIPRENKVEKLNELYAKLSKMIFKDNEEYVLEKCGGKEKLLINQIISGELKGKYEQEQQKSISQASTTHPAMKR